MIFSPLEDHNHSMALLEEVGVLQNFKSYLKPDLGNVDSATESVGQGGHYKFYGRFHDVRQ